MKLEYEGIGEEELASLLKSVYELKDSFDISNLDRRVKSELHEKVVKPALDIRPRDRVLELGVGYGQHLSSYTGVDYVGLDLGEKTIEIARMFASHFGLDPNRTRKKKPGKIPFKNEAIDKIFSVCALHESPAIEPELEEMHRVLRNEGKVVIVERMCAINKSEEAIMNLKREPALFRKWLGDRGYVFAERNFRSTYWGESLSLKPDFQFYMLVGHKTRL